MKVALYDLILFFVCLNLAVYLVNETHLVGDFYIPPYEEPSNILSRLVTLNLTGVDLRFGGTTLAVGGLVGLITGNLVYGGILALILFALDLFIPFAKWVLFGFPTFINQLAEIDGVADPSLVAVALVIQVLMSVVWFWFILGLISQRKLDD